MTDVLAMTGVYIITKLFLNDLPFPVFGVYWFSAGLLWNLLIAVAKPETVRKFNFKRNFLLFLVLVGLLDTTATLMWFKAINDTDNPSLVSFMTNIGPIYAAILGYLFLKERFTISEILGVIITLAGAVLIGYREDFTWQSFLFTGAGLILISSFISAVGKVILKPKIKNYHPIILSINRILYLLSFSLIASIVMGYDLAIEPRLILAIVGGSLLGPFLSAFAGFNALERLKVTTWSILSTSRSFFVLIAGFLVMGILPEGYQIIGGIMTVIGVLIITFARVRK
ncbi:MAG: hypothetical protein C0592_02345 [Marinilabiliales bacterium]|nr:MAG: hypothetical protein C0592_02345 [Marinilabiliales bacterium]